MNGRNRKKTMSREFIVDGETFTYEKGETVQSLLEKEGREDVDIALSWYVSMSLEELFKNVRSEEERLKKIVYALEKRKRDSGMQVSAPLPVTNLPFK